MSRVLALDYGEARCGCALSDPTGTLATPIEVIERPSSRRGMQRIVALVRERDVAEVVVGLPLSLSGEEGPQALLTREWAGRLRSRLGPGVPVELHDERLTTRQGARTRGGAGEGARAAARPPPGGPAG